ncbi:unnamed protein product [Allacma fusca]|uniref:Uncharacterized protein n=1 Tax=Allacma fusca TaxID=39272 RepID=A0A8J2LCY9_9HEXA|nr:unnamed protein product [Allacma fusca]
MSLRKICGCGYATITQTIGGIQIGSLLITVKALFMLYDVHASEEDEERYAAAVGEGILLFEKKFYKNQILAAKWDSTILLIFSSAGLIMGVILLLGSFNRNTAQIYAWIVYTYVTVFICGILMFIFCLFANSSEEAVVKLIFFFASLALQTCLVWVVRVHQKEIEDTTEPVFC